MFGSSSKKKKSNVGLDKSGLTAYGTLFKQDDDAGQAEPEVKPLMETAQETMANAMAAAKLSGVSGAARLPSDAIVERVLAAACIVTVLCVCVCMCLQH